jgi:hypothetical protein
MNNKHTGINIQKPIKSKRPSLCVEWNVLNTANQLYCKEVTPDVSFEEKRFDHKSDDGVDGQGWRQV